MVSCCGAAAAGSPGRAVPLVPAVPAVPDALEPVPLAVPVAEPVAELEPMDPEELGDPAEAALGAIVPMISTREFA